MTKKIIAFSILLILSSCAEVSQQEKEIKKVLGERLKPAMFDTIQYGPNKMLYSDFRKKFKYISVVYLEDGCKPCYPKFLEWYSHQEKIKSLKEYEVLFVIQGYNYDSFISALEEIEPWQNDCYIIMDPYFKFVENNDIPIWILNASVLLNSDNKIKSVGNPFASEEMEFYFYKIISAN